MDDVISLGAGDQVLLDGLTVDGYLEVDESLLTGESLPTLKSVEPSLGPAPAARSLLDAAEPSTRDWALVAAASLAPALAIGWMTARQERLKRSGASRPVE